ncbi:8323_t:CDS:2, partial [Funneliformis geosporum]
LKSTLQQCGKNIITDFIGDKVLGPHLHFATSDLEKILERKGLETLRLRDFSGWMVTSNHDAPLKIDIGDARAVCFEVSARCRGNIAYFDRLAVVIDHPDAPEVVMKYLLSRDLSNYKPQDIPSTKMKIKTMRDQLPNPI